MARPNRRLALCALAASFVVALTGIAAAAEDVPVVNGVFSFGIGISPKQVSKRKPTPIAFSASWRAQPGSVPERPVRELVLEADRHLSLDARGLPSCVINLQPSLRAAVPGRLPERCEGALVGRGSMRGYFFDPEIKPFPFNLKMEIFNAGKRDGVTILRGYSLITLPVIRELFTRIEIRKIANGRYGNEVVVSFPKIPGGSGVITAFDATIDRRFTFMGKPRSVVYLSCPDGKVQMHAEAIFADRSRESEDAIAPCSGRRQALPSVIHSRSDGSSWGASRTWGIRSWSTRIAAETRRTLTPWSGRAAKSTAIGSPMPSSPSSTMRR
jgi:hypothetical protein